MPTAGKIPPSLFSPRIPMGPCGTSTARIREWRRRSKSAALTCSLRMGLHGPDATRARELVRVAPLRNQGAGRLLTRYAVFDKR
jgi:hypothetical protein